MTRRHDGRAGWDDMAAEYDATRAIPGGGEAEAPGRIAAQIAAVGVRRVLEIGVGTGRMALPLARAGVGVVGIDREPAMLARLVAKRGATRLPVVRGDAMALPFRRAFDCVLFSHFLHLVPDAAAFAAELRRVLVPGARLFVVDTGFVPLQAERRVLAAVLPLLGETFVPWPSGERSKERDLLDALLAHLGGTAAPPVEIGRWPVSATLRGELEHVRARAWWTFRRWSPEEAVRAADAAAAALVAEGADLDAAVAETLGVRLLVGRVRD